MKEVDTLILGGRVLLMDEKDTILPAGAVAVDGERIAAVGPLEEIRGRFTGRMEMAVSYTHLTLPTNREV